MKIESGTGNGKVAGVDNENRLRVAAVNLPRGHFISKVNQKAYHLIGEATAANGTVNVLHMRNQTADQTYVINFIRISQVDLAGGTALPNASNYFRVVGGLTYSSGGSSTAAVNGYVGSVTGDGSTHYESNPTLTGTADVFDKHYLKDDGEEWTYTKQGELIIPPGGALTIQFVGDHTSGSLYSRVEYYVSPVDSLD